MNRMSFLPVFLVLLCACAMDVDAGTRDPAAYVREPLMLSSDFAVFVSPSGSDQNDGSARSPFLTVARAHTALLAEKPSGDVYVLLASDKGVYRQQAVNWTFKPAPGKRVYLRPIAWDGSQRPTFHACSTDGSGCISRSFLRLDVPGESNLSIQHLRARERTTRPIRCRSIPASDLANLADTGSILQLSEAARRAPRHRLDQVVRPRALRFERSAAVLSFEGGSSQATQNSGNEVTGCYYHIVPKFRPRGSTSRPDTA